MYQQEAAMKLPKRTPRAPVTLTPREKLEWLSKASPTAIMPDAFAYDNHTTLITYLINHVFALERRIELLEGQHEDGVAQP
jgi:hypothetical protein